MLQKLILSNKSIQEGIVLEDVNAFGERESRSYYKVRLTDTCTWNSECTFG